MASCSGIQEAEREDVVNVKASNSHLEAVVTRWDLMRWVTAIRVFAGAS